MREGRGAVEHAGERALGSIRSSLLTGVAFGPAEFPYPAYRWS